MMHDITKKKRAAMICAGVVGGAAALYFGLLLYAMVVEPIGVLGSALILVLYGGLIGSVIFGVARALRQRLHEIDGGEEEAAKKY